MLPSSWNLCASEAIEAYRYLPDGQVLQIAYVRGRKVYDFPCTPGHYQAFLGAGSKGRYVQNVLRPYARKRGWSRTPYPWPW